MKKITTILMACALVMTMSQCKKEVQVSPYDSDECVTITLNVKGDDGAKTIVDPATGTVGFEFGDIIYVASNGKYVGTISYADGQFSGAISNAIAGQPLHFYYLGNVTPAGNLESGVTTSCTIDISDQSDNYLNGQWHLPVISYGPSIENYGTTTSFTACLQNQCAMAKFNVNTESAKDIFITGVNHIVGIDFSQTPPTFTYSKNAEGFINIGKGEGDSFEKWVILLPQDALGVGLEGSAYDIDNEYIGVRGAIPQIIVNSFFTTGIPVTVNHLNGIAAPIGAINGKFTINSSGDKVYFSQGNLQYIGSEADGYYKFAEHQCDFFGVSSSQSDDYDLFIWTQGNEDHSIINGGDQTDYSWHVLTLNQWNYLLSYRNTLSGTRFAKAIVNGVNGLLLLPDDWKSSIHLLHECNNNLAPYSSNILDSDIWGVMEANGVVFLPSSIVQFNAGYYWTSSLSSLYSNRACSIDITNDNIINNIPGVSSNRAVRLVQDIQ